MVNSRRRVMVAALVLAGISGGGGTVAGPCTLYKEADIVRARENLARHGWAKAVLRSWERQVAYVMEQDRAFVDSMFPELTPWTTYGNNCPVCVGKQSSMGECNLYRWNVRTPEQLVCKYCETVYPNEAFPETGRLVCPRMGQTFTFYQTAAERAHPEDTTGKHAFRWASWPVSSSWSGVIRTRKATWAVSMLMPLAKLYALTGESAYAERVVWILDRFSQVYPDWLYHAYNGPFADCPPGEAAAELGRHPRSGKFAKEVIRSPFGLHQYKDHARLCNGFWGAGRLGTGSGEGSYLLKATVAYDLTRDAMLADGTRLFSKEEEGRVREDLILAGCKDRENWANIHNKAGPNRALSAAVGILFQRPESVRRALEGFERLLEDCFHTDGFCRESPSYSGMHLSLMADIPVLLRGYTDPPGYTPSVGDRFADFNPFQRVSRYRLALESMVRMLAPGRRYPVIGDTHYRGGVSARYAEILTYHYGSRYAPLLESLQGGTLAQRGGEYALWHREPALACEGVMDLPLQTEWFPAWHVGVLRGGEPEKGTALYLNAYAAHGHRHYDTLGLVFYAFGEEMASDRGYIWDDPRNAWTRSTLAHNLVTVDGADQGRKGRRSVLELFGAEDGIEIIRARGEAVYSQCDLYRRTVALIQLGGGSCYAVDVFRVNGGKRHQYGFQCNGTMDGFVGGELVGSTDTHKWLKEFRGCVPEGTVRATWHDSERKFDLLVLNDCDRIAVADAPGWRSDRGSELNAPAIQQLFCNRSRAAGNLRSNFVAVMAPYVGESPVLSASSEESADGTVGIRVESAGRTDWLVSRGELGMHTIGPLRTDAAFAYVAVDSAGVPIRAYMLGGTRLVCHGLELTTAEAEIALDVERATERTLHLRRPLEAPERLVGQYVLIAETGYEIVEARARSLTVRDYPLQPAEHACVLSAVSFSRP
jgi:hypothetical protein